MSKVLEWSTEFDTVNSIMTQKFSERVSMVTDLKSGIVKVFKDGDELIRHEDLSVNQMNDLCLSVAINAKKIEVDE